MELDIAVIPADISKAPYALHIDNLKALNQVIGAGKLDVVYLEYPVEGRLFTNAMHTLGVFEQINIRATALMWGGNESELYSHRYVAGDAVVAHISDDSGLDDRLREFIYGGGQGFRLVIFDDKDQCRELRTRFASTMEATAEGIRAASIMGTGVSIQIYKDEADVPCLSE